jgi:pimeloyl-ACP methyl ester carboxylesterase
MPTMTRSYILAAVALLLAACVDSTDRPASPVAPLASTAAPDGDAIIDGSTGPGSLYRLARPANWNGDLVIYAHGYVYPDQPVALPPEGDQFIGMFGAQGFAVAFSSYSENGSVVKDGAQRTHQLLGIFTSKFGKPNRVYLGGASMGGLIAIKLAETHPEAYVGVLAACAVAGGEQRNADYRAHVRVLFDFFYPGVLPGTAAFLPNGTDVGTQIIAPAIAAMTANPTPALWIALVSQTPAPFANGAELVESIVTALASNAGDLTDVVLTKGKPYFDNRSTVYSSAALPAALLGAINGGVQRFDASPAALASLDHNYTPSGSLQIPMLMLSNVRDPIVPGFNQASYLAVATANGASSLLVQRQVNTYGHCVFTPTEIGTAFTDLVLWVQYGITPTP